MYETTPLHFFVDSLDFVHILPVFGIVFAIWHRHLLVVYPLVDIVTSKEQKMKASQPPTYNARDRPT